MEANTSADIALAKLITMYANSNYTYRIVFARISAFYRLDCHRNFLKLYYMNTKYLLNYCS